MTIVTLKGKPVSTNGELPAVGAKAPDFRLVGGDLADVSLATYAGKRKVLNIVPSLDTPTCQRRPVRSTSARPDSTTRSCSSSLGIFRSPKGASAPPRGSRMWCRSR